MTAAKLQLLFNFQWFTSNRVFSALMQHRYTMSNEKKLCCICINFPIAILMAPNY